MFRLPCIWNFLNSLQPLFQRAVRARAAPNDPIMMKTLKEYIIYLRAGKGKRALTFCTLFPYSFVDVNPSGEEAAGSP
jgi:hypothetical protein